MATITRQKVRIRLRAFDHRLLDQSAEKIVDTVKRTGARVSGPVLFPTDKVILCVNRGTTIDKESMEHFEQRTHKRLIDILEPGPKTIDALMRCRDAMVEDGKVLVIEPVVPQGNEPSVGKFLDVTMLVMQHGRVRTESEHRALFEAAGLELTRTIPTSSPLRLIEGARRL